MTPLLDDGEGEVLADLVRGRAERVDRVFLGEDVPDGILPRSRLFLSKKHASANGVNRRYKARGKELKSSCLALALLGFFAGCANLKKSDRPDNFLFHAVSGRAGQIEQAQRPRIIRHRFVDVEFELLSGTEPFEEKAASGHLVLLNLFDDATFRAILDRREVRSGQFETFANLFCL